MQGYFAVATVSLLIIMVSLRVFMLKKRGIKAMRFGEMDKKDFWRNAVYDGLNTILVKPDFFWQKLSSWY